MAATPLVRATRLEKELGTPARIYFKDESISPSGSHKTNTAVPQAFYNASAARTPTTRWARCSTTCCCTRP